MSFVKAPGPGEKTSPPRRSFSRSGIQLDCIFRILFLLLNRFTYIFFLPIVNAISNNIVFQPASTVSSQSVIYWFWLHFSLHIFFLLYSEYIVYEKQQKMQKFSLVIQLPSLDESSLPESEILCVLWDYKNGIMKIDRKCKEIYGNNVISWVCLFQRFFLLW